MRVDAYKKARSFQYKLKHGLIKKNDNRDKIFITEQNFNYEIEESMGILN